MSWTWHEHSTSINVFVLNLMRQMFILLVVPTFFILFYFISSTCTYVYIIHSFITLKLNERVGVVSQFDSLRCWNNYHVSVYCLRADNVLLLLFSIGLWYNNNKNKNWSFSTLSDMFMWLFDLYPLFTHIERSFFRSWASETNLGVVLDAYPHNNILIHSSRCVSHPMAIIT